MHDDQGRAQRLGRSPLGGWEVTARLPLHGRPGPVQGTEDG